jgi:hypothetical protein
MKDIHERTLIWLDIAIADLREHSPEDLPAAEHALACVQGCAAWEKESAEMDKIAKACHLAAGIPAPRTAAERLAEDAAGTREPRCGYCGKDTVHPFRDGWHCTLCGRVTPYDVEHTPPGCPSGEGASEEPLTPVDLAALRDEPDECFGCGAPLVKAGHDLCDVCEDHKRIEAAPAIRTGSGGKPEPAGASPGGGGRGSMPERVAWAVTAAEGVATLRRERDEARAAHAAAISERDFFEQHLNVTRTKLATAHAAMRMAKGMIVAVREYRDEEGNSPFNVIDHYSLADIEKQLRACLPEGEG